MRKNIGMVVVAAIAIAAVVTCTVPLKTVSYTASVPYQTTETYYEQEPYQIEECHNYTHYVTATILDGGYSVPPGFDYPLSIHLGLQGAAVNGLVREETGYGIDFYVFYGTDYYSWKLGQHNIPLVNLSDVTSEFFSLILPVPGDYYFVLSNRNSSKHKLVRLEAYCNNYPVTEQTCENTTKYRDVEKQRTVTGYRQETRYEKVSLLDYLLHY
jgi:hypothetical protein